MWAIAEIYSITPLLNSLFFEWKNYIHQSPFIEIQHQNKTLRIELKKFSKIGHHQYTGAVYLEDERLSFKDFILLLSELVGLENKDSFLTRVLMSKSSIEEALLVNINHLETISPNFTHTETALFVGHSLHPAPKSRSEFNKSDLLHFSPEHGAKYKISWFKIHKSIYYEKRSTFFKDSNWASHLTALKASQDFYLLPIHPWQKVKILNLPVIKDYISRKLIIDLGEDERIWTPTSSLRTVYNEDSKYMVKFSLDLKMTNSIRHLLIHELQRGIQIDEVSNHSYLKNFFKEYPHFKIIQEPCYAGIIDLDQSVMTQTLIMLRENPFSISDEVSLLATLTQPPLNSEKGLLFKLIGESKLRGCEWFELFLEKAITPLLILQGQYGILLGAHQQNLILKLNSGKPIGAYFRDCHGTGFDAKKIEVLRKDIPSIEDENGNILEEEISHYLFAYYLIINSVFNMITAISAQTQESEEDLMTSFKHFLQKLKKKEELDASFINYLLESPELKHKGNFFCTIKNINENTTKNPLSIYTSIKNPLKEQTYV